MQKKINKYKPKRKEEFKPRGKELREDKYSKERDVKATNDIAFYDKYPELLAAVSRIPFPYVPGMKLPTGDLNYVSGDQTYQSKTDVYYPGVMSLHYAPGVGYSADNTSPASIASREMYAKIRSKFSGPLDCDGPDLFMYTVALQQLHAYISTLKRIYRCIDYRTGNNRTVPDDLLRSMGLSGSEILDVVHNKERLWAGINTLIHSASAFAVPDDMPIFRRATRLNYNVYRDTPSLRSQLYVFVQDGYYKFALRDTADEVPATALEYNEWAPLNKTVDGLIGFGQSLIAALNGNDDAWTIDGYIRRAYEGSSFVVSELLSQTDIVEPVYDFVILSQIENFTSLNLVTNMDITQVPSTNAVIFKPMAVQEYTVSTVLNIHTEAIPTPVDVVESSRFKAYVDNDGYVHGSDTIPLYAKMLYRFGDNNDVQEFVYDYVIEYNVGSTALTNFGTTFDTFMRSIAFSGAPACWVLATSGNKSISWFVCDIAQATVLSNEQLNEITRVCLYSEFNVFTRV